MLKQKGFTSFLSKFLLFCSVLATTIGCASTPNNHAAPERYISDSGNVEHMMRSTVGLFSEERNIFFCSGFYISPDTIVTARHCVIDADELEMLHQAEVSGDIEVKNYLQQKIFIIAEYDAYSLEDEDSFKGARVVYFDSTESPEKFDVYDLAVLKLIPGEQKSHHWLKVAKENPKIGEKVYSFAFPIGIPWILSEGIVAQHVIGEPGTPVDVLMINSTVTFGSSGSGFVNNKGEVVALTSMIATRAGFISFAMSAERMSMLLYGWEG